MGKEIPFSILDLSFVRENETSADALHHTLEVAQLADRLGYKRFWLAEHHNMEGIASAATSVVIGYIAAGTSTIRVGSGGIMLPNHAPLVIAEQFGTLESLYPGRIDLGLGRAPGTDGPTMRALRRSLGSDGDTFPQDVVELQSYFAEVVPGQIVRAVPGAGLNVPIWLLGSSLFSAELAAHLGLPFAFASHFAPDDLMAALRTYRDHFRPSETLEAPHAMVAVNVYAADTDAEAQRQFTSAQIGFLNLIRGTRGKMQPPVESMDGLWSASEKAAVASRLAVSVVGNPETVQSGLEKLINQTNADELITVSRIYDQPARLHSFELLATVRDRINERSLADSLRRNGV